MKRFLPLSLVLWGFLVFLAPLFTFAQNPSVPAQSPSPIPAAPIPPGIFGVGFTNITDSSARLVFTTSEPMTSTVMIYDEDKEFSRSSQSKPEEIHAVDLTGLSRGKEYKIAVTGVTVGGQSVTSEKFTLKPAVRAASSHHWPGYTIFGTTMNGGSDAVLDLLTQSGVRMALVEAPWDGLMPRGREIDRGWLDRFSRQIAELKKRNIEPLVILDYCVPWAKTYTDKTMTWRNRAFGPPDRLDDWEYYLPTIVTALHGSARYYEIWDEPDAGLLATGRYVERPNLPPPIGRPPFKDNWNYWLGDRYVPMISRVREVMDELQPDAVLMNGGWNRDYAGSRGDLLFERGIAPDLDVYAFHCYSGQPLSFSRWYDAIDGGFRKNIDRIFDKHHVRMPLAVTEWGWPAWGDPQPGKGFVSFEDSQKYFVKSTFYFLGLQRVEILGQFCLGIGPDTRDKDPLFFMLANQSADGKLVIQPTFKTFQWLATTFGSRPYEAWPVQVRPSEQVKAVAIRLKDSGDTYLAVWQDGVPNDKGIIPAQPAREVAASLELPDGKYTVQNLDLAGTKISESEVSADHSLQLKTVLPEISFTSESGIYLAKITATKP